MLLFKCYTCGQDFKIANENLYNKIAIQCQNCDSPMPNEAIDALRRYSEAYMDLIDILLHHKNFSKKPWGISILGTDKIIPKEPDSFHFNKPREGESYWNHRNKPFQIKTPNDLDEPF